MPRWDKTPAERILEKVIKTDVGCWIWTGSVTNSSKPSNSYGNVIYKGRLTPAHRASYQEFKGEIPVGLLVLHRCDIPLCVNPDHLFVGSQSDNMYDMTNKNRHPYTEAEEHHRSKLTNDQVREIRGSLLSHGKMAKEMGVTKRTIINVRQMKVYRSVT